MIYPVQQISNLRVWSSKTRRSIIVMLSIALTASVMTAMAPRLQTAQAVDSFACWARDNGSDFDITWTDVAAAEKYVVYRQVDDSANWNWRGAVDQPGLEFLADPESNQSHSTVDYEVRAKIGSTVIDTATCTEGALPQSWVILQAWQGRPKNRGRWFTNNKYGCEGATFSGNDCDEYPWRATSQGGGNDRDGAVNGVERADVDIPHLRVINGSQNRASGRELKTFWDACGVNDNDWFLSIPLPLDQLAMGYGLPVIDSLPMEHLAPSMFIGPDC